MYSAAFSLYLIVSTVFSLLSTLVINKFVEKKFEKVAAKQEEEKYLKRYGNILKNKKEDN
jgi:membrane protein insertase Oxa1/YidC/SpoIIIJ